ncbi:MAG: FecR domain-containing protein [Sphingomonas sp.]
MSRRVRTCALATAVALLAATPAAAQNVGIAAAVRNSVEVRPRGAPRPRPIAVRAPVALADEVHTRPQSQLQVLLLDQSTFTVGANAVVTIDRFVYDPNRGARSMGATVTRGAFRFMSGRPAGVSSTNSTIRTPAASIGIRGTMVDGVVGRAAVDIASREAGVGPGVGGDNATASLIVLRGPGPLQQGNARPGVIDVTAAGKTLTLDRPMLAVYVPGRGKPPIGPFRISPTGLAKLQAFLIPLPLPAAATALSLHNVANPRGGTGGGGGGGAAGGTGGAAGAHAAIPSLTWLAVLVPAAGVAALSSKDRPRSP